ncbi:MAG: carbohydrate kinase family protein [archaeon GB-1867-005]|nr:carbohydrate kinase family protein [Candidatus Culexmicrobium cathedralense]
MKVNLENLAYRIAKVKAKFTVTAMPDFFIDHFIIFPSSIEELVMEIKEAAKRHGGNIFKGHQYLLRGGCAANFASALAKLGVKVKLIAETNIIGRHILEVFAENVDLNHLKIGDEYSITAALEVKVHDKNVNIMISYPGPASNFGPEKLNESDYETIMKSDFIAIFSWNMNKRANNLIKEVFSRAKNSGKSKTYLDLGDPTSKKDELKKLIREVLVKDLVDALSVNENELIQLASAINVNIGGDHQGRLIGTLKAVSMKLNLRIDLHTACFAATAYEGEIKVVPTFAVKVLRVTGAGDAWNAGNIFGWGINLTDVERLMVANAVAAYYISNEHAEHPSLSDLARFLINNKSNLHKLNANC